MKKIISMLLALSMMISCVCMVSVSAEAAQGTATPPVVAVGGASIITTNRNHRCSSPSQEIVEGINKYGAGTYYISGNVRFLKTPDAPVTVGLGATVVGDTTSWPQTSKLTITDTAWHQVSGTWNVKNESITSAKTFAEVLYQGKTGDAGRYLGDMEWDAFTVCYVYPDGTYGENLFVNPDMNIAADGTTAGWGKNQGMTLTNSVLPVQGGGALHVEDRSSGTSGPSQDITARLEQGTYLYSAYVRLVNAPTTALSFSMGIELKLNGAGVGWPNPGTISISDTNWHKISGTVNINKDFDTAVTFINEATAADIEIDGVFLAKQNADGTYSENIIKNPTMECDQDGNTTDWGCYRVATITNTAYDPVESEDGVENPDGSVTYASGGVPVTDKNIYYSGRWNVTETKASGSFESYIQLKFTGTSLKVIAPASGNVWVEVDGAISALTLGTATTLASGLSEGEHTVRIYSRAQQAFPSISGFVIDKGAKTLAYTPSRIIEFVGDSIMEGYYDAADKIGDEPNNSMTNSYGYKTGKMLAENHNMAFNIVAFGGIGIVKTNSPDVLTMPQRYFKEREFVSGDTVNSTGGAWDTTKYTPDYIVINLGTNDNGYDSSTFITNYVSFVEDLKEAYPNVVIFLMTPFNGAKAYEVTKVAAEFDKDVYLVDSANWGVQGGSDGLHPAPAGHDLATEKLYKALDEYITNGEAPEAPELPAGYEFKVTEDYVGQYPIFLSQANLSADMAENGYITQKFTVYNTGTATATVNLRFQYDKWYNLDTGSNEQGKTIEPGKCAEYVFSIPVNSLGYAGSEASTIDISRLYFRHEINQGAANTLKAGTAYVIIPEGNADTVVSSTLSKMGYANATTKTGASSKTAVYQAPNAEIKGATLEIGASLTLNYVASLWDRTDAILRVTHNNKSIDLQGVYDEATGLYKFSYKGINPQCMADNVKAELIVDGEVISSKDEYSVKTYADNLMKKTAQELNMSDAKYDAFISLLSDMLVYGDESQKYKNYNLTEFATDGITWLNASEFTVPTDGVKNIVSGNTDVNDRVEASGVYIANVNKIYFRLTLTDGVTVLVDGKEATPDSEGKVYTEDILATGFSKIHTAELIKNGETVAKVEYNLNAYVQTKHNSDTVGAIVKALSNYGASAKAYASAQ